MIVFYIVIFVYGDSVDMSCEIIVIKVFEIFIIIHKYLCAEGDFSMEMALPILLISMILFFVLFFGIGFLLNMLLRMSWVMAIIYPIIGIRMIDKVKLSEYFTNSKEAFTQLEQRFASLQLADILILSSGMLGALLAGVVIKMLRNRGYQMF